MKIKKLFTVFVIIFIVQIKSFGQTGSGDSSGPSNIDTQTINEIDLLLKQNLNAAPEGSTEVLNKPMTTKEIKKLNISDYSKIISNASYDDYSVVQKNYMPKTSRVQLKSGLTTVTNDVFYTIIGLSLGAIYNFNETWGLGLSGVLLSSNQTKQTENIRDIQRVNIESLVTLKNTYNASVYFSPIYGKWSLLNKQILPFEIYFSAGMAQVTNQSSLVSTATSAGVGQLISLTRSSALDINLQWLMYSTKNINNQDQSNNSLLLTVGYSIFWPKPDYR